VASAPRDPYLHSQELKRPAESSPHPGTYSYKTNWIFSSHLGLEAGTAQSVYWISYALYELRISDQFPAGARDFPLLPAYTGYWTQPTLYSMGNGGSFFGEKRLRSETTIQLHIMRGAIPPFPPKNLHLPYLPPEPTSTHSTPFRSAVFTVGLL